MTRTSRIVSGVIFALGSITSLASTAVAESRPNADPQLCAEYLRDLKTYRRMAEQLGCQMPENAPASVQAISGPTENVQFPPVIADEAPAATSFPPVVEGPATSQADAGFPPVVEADEGAQKTDFPPVETGSSSNRGGSTKGSSGSRHASGSSSGNFPPVVASADPEPETSFDETVDPVRAAIDEKLEIIKEDVKARVRAAAIEKAEEINERIKDKIARKIDSAVNHHHANAQDGEHTLRHAAKTAVKRMLSEHHRGEGLLGKLAGLRRR